MFVRDVMPKFASIKFQPELFYKGKLNTYNINIYDLGTFDAHCYVWNKSIAKHGAPKYVCVCKTTF